MIVNLEQFLHEKYTEILLKRSRILYFSKSKKKLNCIDLLHLDDIVVNVYKYIVNKTKLLMLISNSLVFQMHILNILEGNHRPGVLIVEVKK